MKTRRIAVALWMLLWASHSVASGQGTTALAVAPEPILRIGGMTAGLESSFTDVVGISVIGDSILVLDSELKEIRIFDHRGRFLGSIGREGEGPGEFAWPTAMRLLPGGVAVVDLRLRRETLFSLRGEVIRTDPLGRLGNQPLGGSATLRDGSVVSETSVSMNSEGGSFPERLLLLNGPTSTHLDTIARYSTGYVPYRAPSSFGFLSETVGSEGRWGVAGDSVLAVVSGEPAVLRWWWADEGGMLKIGDLALPLRPEALSPRDVDSLVESENERRRNSGEDQLARSATIDAPRYWGQVKRLVVSERHECWIQWDRPRSNDDNEWFRVDLSRREAVRTRLPGGFSLLAVNGDRLYGVVLGEYDVPAVTVFRARE